MKKIISLLITFLFSIVFNCDPSNTLMKQLELFYTFNLADDPTIQPSYQTAIWLEDSLGQYIQTLFVSEYLSYGGYNDSTICPDWSSKSDWDSSTEELCDAVTKATPQIGENVFSFTIKDFNDFKMPYICYIQTHIIENFNLKAKCIINSDFSITNFVNIDYSPLKYTGTEFILENVNVKLSQ